MTAFITKNDVPEASDTMSFMEVAELVEGHREFKLRWRGSGDLWISVTIADASMSHGRWDVVVEPTDSLAGGKARVYLTSLRALDGDDPLPWE
jgi:hypothetical protein